MSAPLATICRAAVNPPNLASKAITDPHLLPKVFDGLNADKPRVKYGCAKALRLISEQRPERLYPHWDFFVRLLDHENKILQWNAAYVLSQLARVDRDKRINAMLDRYLAPIPGPV